MRWTAVEALESHRLNEKTDAWSFGVLVYEIWTRAELPYVGWSNQKVWAEVEAGYRLPQPSGCSDDVFAEMSRCWASQQDARPTLAELAQFFRTHTTGNLKSSKVG